MGKAGKARKRQKLEKAVEYIADSDSDDDSQCEESLETEILIAISVFDALALNLTDFSSKQYKPLRIAIYPLILEQKGKFFEDVSLPITEAQALEVLSTRNLSIAVKVANHFSTSMESFRSPELKQYRRALYPLVAHHFNAPLPVSKTGKSKPTKASRHTGELHPKTSSDPDNSKKTNYRTKVRNLSNHISSCFRQGLWSEAYIALREMASDPSETPKLGAAQRWVRECDTESFSNAAVETASAALAAATRLSYPHAPKREENSIEEKSIEKHESIPKEGSAIEGAASEVGMWRPSYAMGTKGLVGLSCDSELYRMRKDSIKLLWAVIQVMQSKAFSQVPSTPSVASINERNAFVVDSSSSDDVVEEVDCIQHPPFAARSTSATSAPLFHNPQDAAAYLRSLSMQQDSSTVDHSCPDGKASNATGRYPVLLPRDVFMKDYVSVVSHLEGHLRRPPSEYDLRIYMTSPNTIKFDLGRSVGTCRHDVPNVPGCFLLSNVLTPSECAQLILAAETIGYIPDAVDGIENVQWLADSSIFDVVNARCSPLLPSHIDGLALGGVNAKFRLFRYFPGAVYRPHIDGAWPGSGLAPDGSYSDDVYDGKRHSRLTFLIYLNGGFEGGETTFFLGDPPHVAEDLPTSCKSVAQAKKYIHARAVTPQVGSVLCFPHGAAVGSLVHEGSAVRTGVKYVIRTDVLYEI